MRIVGKQFTINVIYFVVSVGFLLVVIACCVSSATSLLFQFSKHMKCKWESNVNKHPCKHNVGLSKSALQLRRQEKVTNKVDAFKSMLNFRRLENWEEIVFIHFLLWHLLQAIDIHEQTYKITMNARKKATNTEFNVKVYW